jgi:hypothetical protein
MPQHLLVYATVPMPVTARLLDPAPMDAPGAVRVGFFAVDRPLAEWVTSRSVWAHLHAGEYLAHPRRVGLIAHTTPDGGLRASLVLLIPEDDGAFTATHGVNADGEVVHGMVAEPLEMAAAHLPDDGPGSEDDIPDSDAPVAMPDGAEPWQASVPHSPGASVSTPVEGAASGDAGVVDGADTWDEHPDDDVADAARSAGDVDGGDANVPVVATDLFVIGQVERVAAIRRFPHNLAREAMDVLRAYVVPPARRRRPDGSDATDRAAVATLLASLPPVGPSR